MTVFGPSLKSVSLWTTFLIASGKLKLDKFCPNCNKYRLNCSVLSENIAEYCRGCAIGHFNLIRVDLSRITSNLSLKSFLRNWMTHPGFKAVVCIRIMNHFYAKKRYKISLMLRIRLISKFGVDIFPGCKIDSGLRLEHPVGIVIGRGVSIGKYATLMHGVTLGQNDLRSTGTSVGPNIGDGVLIGAHACVFGSIRVPKDSFIPAKALVTEKNSSMIYRQREHD